MRNLKHIIRFLLILQAISSFSQESYFIKGDVLNKSNEPVEFATLYNLTKKTSCITNIKGEFKLKAVKGDSVRIQHLNYKTKELVITNPTPRFILEEKEFLIPEVTVSPQAAFDLFNTACENTWHSFKEENITRAYCRVERKNGPKTSQQVDLDLDIVQKKQKSFKRGEKITSYKIQERIVTDTFVLNHKLDMTLNLFYPQIHRIYWVDLPNQFNYYKEEDEENIKLYLISKTTYDQKCNIEVTIQKGDTLLRSFAMVKKDLYTEQKYSYDADTFHILNTRHFIEYNYSDGFGHLSKYFQSMTVQDPMNPGNAISITQQLNTSNNGALAPKKRRNRRKIFRNSFNLGLVTNRYEYEFWDGQANFVAPYNFEGLEKMNPGKIDNN